jgi:snRNA-activating protein complex subunit 3
MSSRWHATSSVHLSERDYDIQCDDLSDLLSVKDFKETCSELYQEILATHVTHDTPSGGHVTGHTQDMESEITEACNTASLLPPGGLDPYLKGKKSSVLKNTQLQCLVHADVQKDYFERKGLTRHSSGVVVPPRCTGVKQGEEDAETDSDTREVTVNHPEVILSVYIYHPIKKRRDIQALVLGSQRLSELRDKILCFRDFIVDKDYSENPTEFDHDSLMKGDPPNRSKSAFFFINNTFYNDRRHPESQDLSAPIIAWTRETNIELSPRLDHYTTADMAATRLDQLRLRLGYPYLFCHHFTCQHLIIFTDLRYILYTVVCATHVHHTWQLTITLSQLCHELVDPCISQVSLCRATVYSL